MIIFSLKYEKRLYRRRKFKNIICDEIEFQNLTGEALFLSKLETKIAANIFFP